MEQPTLLLTLLALLWGWMLLPATASANPLDLKVSVSDDPVVRGQSFFYRLMATNTRDVALENVTIRWIVPAGLQRFDRRLITGVNSFPSGSCGFSCDPGNLLIMNLGTLLPGASREVQIPVSISPDLPAADLPRALLADFEGTYTGGGQFLADETVTIAFAKSLEVALSATPTPLAPNGELIYTLTFGNTGQQAVTNADLTLQLPSNVTVLDNGGGVQSGNRIIWSITQLNAGISDRRQVRVRDTSGAVSRVLASQVEIDDRIGVGPDARMSLLTPVRASRPLQVSLAVSADPVKRGQGLFYRLTATNTNPVSGAPLENVTLRWIVPAGLQRFDRRLITGVSSFSSGSCGFSCDPGNLLIMNLGTLLPGESREVQIPINASADAPFGRLIPVRLFGNYDTDSREWAVAAETVAIEQSKSLDIKLNAAPAPVAPGNPFVYELIYGNTSASAINGALELTLPPGIQVLDGDGGFQTGNTLAWSRIGPLGSGQGDRRQVRVQNNSGEEGRLLPAEARLIDNANPKSWATRTAFATAARTNRPLSLAADLSKDPLASGDIFRYTLIARNTNPPSGASLENVTLRWIVPAGLQRFDRRLITGVSSFSSGSCGFSCDPGNLLIMNLGTLLPGESREVQIPVALANNVPAGTLLEAHFVGDAALPNGVSVQQVIATATALVGQYLPIVPRSPVKPDLNSDGIDDLAGVNSAGAVYYTTNRSAWSPIPGVLTQLVAGDLNGDGRANLVGLNSAGHIYYTANLTTWTRIPGVLTQLVVGDFNGNGRADLAGLNSAGHIYYTTNLSTWTRIPGVLTRLVVGDFNGDGRDDLAGLNSAGHIYYTTNRSTWTRIPGTLARLAAGDFNGDGRDDLAGLNSAGHIYYTTNRASWIRIPGVLNRLVAGDFNGDGREDLAGLNSAGHIYYTTNLNTWTRIPGTLSRLVVGDFNGNGRANLAGINSAGSIYYTTNMGTWTQIPGRLNRLAGDTD